MLHANERRRLGRAGTGRAVATRDEAWVTKHSPQAPNYDRKLARHIVLADGRRLRTLKDAADLLLDVFSSVNARSGALDDALGSLIRAATTGRSEDNEAATDAIERALREWRLL